MLVAAYACNPSRGSEEAVGWNWVQTIARDHKVTVLTAAFHERDIRSACDPEANPRFVFVRHRPWHYRPTPWWRAIEGSVAKPLMNLAYAQWQRDAAREAKRFDLASFDLVHQLTYVGFRFPGLLWRLGLPFVWGPIGGMENTAWHFLPTMGFKGAIYYAGRNLINSAQRRWLASPRCAARVAGPGLIAATLGIARQLKQCYGANSTIISEVVAPLELSPEVPRKRAPAEPLKLVWSGLHLPGKALNLLLDALARLGPDAPVELHILGNGPMTERWRNHARQLGIATLCRWHGMVPRASALELTGNAHVLVISSLKDLTSTVLLEGLALGLPVVCPDHCGFSNVVTPNCGIKLPVDSAERLVDGFAQAIAMLQTDERTRLELAHGALARARDFGPEQLRDRLRDVYGRTLAARVAEVAA